MFVYGRANFIFANFSFQEAVMSLFSYILAYICMEHRSFGGGGGLTSVFGRAIGPPSRPPRTATGCCLCKLVKL